MKPATLVLLLKGEPATEILLGYKKTGFGTGKITGIGGKSNPARRRSPVPRGNSPKRQESPFPLHPWGCAPSWSSTSPTKPSGNTVSTFSLPISGKANPPKAAKSARSGSPWRESLTPACGMMPITGCRACSQGKNSRQNSSSSLTTRQWSRRHSSRWHHPKRKRHGKSRAFGDAAIVYATLTGLLLSHRPWILHMETACRVPGSLIFMETITS